MLINCLINNSKLLAHPILAKKSQQKLHFKFETKTFPFNFIFCVGGVWMSVDGWVFWRKSSQRFGHSLLKKCSARQPRRFSHIVGNTRLLISQKSVELTGPAQTHANELTIRVRTSPSPPPCPRWFPPKNENYISRLIMGVASMGLHLNVGNFRLFKHHEIQY